MRTKLTLATIRDKIKTIFGDSFDFPYLEQEFQNTSSVITMVCPIHGPTKKKLNSIINLKAGCRHCSQLKKAMTVYFGYKQSPQEMQDFYTFVRAQGLIRQPIFPTKTNHAQLMSLYSQHRLKSGYRPF